MSSASSTALQLALAVALVVFVAYAAGRVHEWYRHSLERDRAFREGYNQASRSLFQLATRATTTAGAPADTGRRDPS